MNAKQLAELLVQPQHIQNISYDELENILVEYPYCGVVRLLLLKKCHLDKHPAFEQQLHLAAVHLPDRVRLHDFLKNQDANDVPIFGKLPPFPVPDSFPNDANSNDNKKKTELEIIPLDGLLQKTKKKRFRLPRIPVLEDKELLLILSGNHTDLLPVMPKKNKERKPMLDIPPDMEAFLKSLATKKHTQENGLKEYPELDEIAQKSLAENEEIISENLAEILAQQGQSERAAKMYSALSLKFPQKSHIFASKIALLNE